MYDDGEDPNQTKGETMRPKPKKGVKAIAKWNTQQKMYRKAAKDNSARRKGEKLPAYRKRQAANKSRATSGSTP